METRNNIVESIDIFRAKVVHIIANISGQTEPKAEIIVLTILGYITIILLLTLIHRKLIKRHKNIHENLILLYDTIRYQIAKAQYENPAIQDTKGIRIVIEANQKNYLTNTKTIKKEVIAIEQKLGQQIIGDDQRNTIYKQTNMKSIIKKFIEIIGRFITLITAGIYKLFW